MKIKKIIPLIIAIELLFQLVLYAEEKLPKDKPGTAVFVMSTEEKVIVTSELIQYKTKGLLIDLKIPTIQNLKNKFFQKRINNMIKKEQLYLMDEIKKDAKIGHQYALDNGFPVIPYELMSNYHVQSNDRIFSLEITIYDYRGGAHGMTTKTYYNIDTQQNKLLTLKDYFKPGSDYKTIINEEIFKQIKERQQQGEVFFDDEGGFKGIKDDQSFYINSNGQLVIVFGLYEIAPYVAGIIEFPIPNQAIDNMLLVSYN